MHKFFLGIIAGCFFAIFHLLPGSLAAQEICPFSTTSGNAIYLQEWRSQLQWAPDNPQEIARNQSVTLHVINGTAPYKWSVAEPGFSLIDTDNNAGDANTLCADNTACGSATITVTDSAGDSVIGYIRGTSGRWVAKTLTYEKCSFMKLAGTPTYGSLWATLIAGNKKLDETYWHGSGCGGNATQCLCESIAPNGCGTVFADNTCLTHETPCVSTHNMNDHIDRPGCCDNPIGHAWPYDGSYLVYRTCITVWSKGYFEWECQ